MRARELLLLRVDLERVIRERDAAVVAVRELEVELARAQDEKREERKRGWAFMIERDVALRELDRLRDAGHVGECRIADPRPTPVVPPWRGFRAHPGSPTVTEPDQGRVTPAETPKAKAVEAALRNLGPVTEGEP
jgi:hypothetical protein